MLCIIAAAEVSSAKAVGIIAIAFLVGISVGLLVYFKVIKKK